MIRWILLMALLCGLAACAAPDRFEDGGIGGTGAPANPVTQV